MSDGDVIQVEEARTRKGLKHQSLECPMDEQTKCGCSIVAASCRPECVSRSDVLRTKNSRNDTESDTEVALVALGPNGGNSARWRPTQRSWKTYSPPSFTLSSKALPPVWSSEPPSSSELDDPCDSGR